MKEGAGGHVRLGAALYVVGSTQFFVLLSIVALHYGPRGYNPLTVTISDLQAVNCGLFQGSQVCSPLHAIANLSVATVGLTLLLGSVFFRDLLPGGRRSAPLILMVVAGLSTFANAFTPEDVTFIGDLLTALVAFVSANFGLIQIGRTVSAIPGRRNFGLITEVLGVEGVAALILSGTGLSGPLGNGGTEWLVIAPILLWMLFGGLYLLLHPSAQDGAPVGMQGPAGSPQRLEYGRPEQALR